MSNPFPEEWLQKCLGDLPGLSQLRGTERDRVDEDALG